MGLLSTLFARRDDRGPNLDVNSASERELIAEARRLIGQEAPADAYHLLRQALDRFPSSAALHKLNQYLQVDLAQPILAAELEKLHSGDENSADQYGRIAELYRHLGNSAEAIHYGHVAIQAEPQASCGYKAVGRVYVDLFRVSGDSIAGMNALRYVAKAHSLAPRDSQSLLHLAEIFAILEAPIAAQKFLGPVQEAFPQNSTVLRLGEQLGHLQPEETTQIQDLFLRYEDRRSGSEQATSVEFSAEQIDEFLTAAGAHDGVVGVYLIDRQRSVLGGFHEQDFDQETVGDTLGMLIDTCHQNSTRMELGNLTWFSVMTESGAVVVYPIAAGATAVCFGNSNSGRIEIVEFLERATDNLTNVCYGEV